MPKEIKTYQCQYCNTIYDNIVLAERCEDSHIPIRDYMPKYESRESEYPERFLITFDNKKVITYHKEDESQQCIEE